MSEGRSLQQRVIILAVVGAVLAGLLFIGLRQLGDDGATEIVLRNTGECPEVTMQLRARDGSENISLIARPGEEDRADVQPNKIYDYEITTPSEPDANNRVCNLTDQGTVTVPEGASQTFNIASERPDTNTPEATEASTDGDTSGE